jgi:hypothetical protein
MKKMFVMTNKKAIVYSETKFFLEWLRGVDRDMKYGRIKEVLQPIPDEIILGKIYYKIKMVRK